ncbi:MAG: hypothetical protein JRF17_00195 [Deltaproteobacteria bacterium]|jgi:hypothetical protein|nr:hypothetical protein [Deltaproteobacteria bacterium]
MPENRAAPLTESKKSQKETALISDTKPFYGWWIVAAIKDMSSWRVF